MANPVGNYDIIRALNTSSPIARRVQLGTLLNNLVSAVNAMAIQNDIGLAFDTLQLTYNTAGGTYTIAGSIANGNFFTVTLVNASFPALVTPGLIIGPIQIVTADTVTTVAAKLVKALNANLALTAAGIVASNVAGVVTVKVPGTTATTLTATLSPGAVITVTPVNIAAASGTGTVVSRMSAAFSIPPLNTIP